MPARPPAAPIDLDRVRAHTLPNGLRVRLLADASTPTISYYTFVTGWRSFNYSGNSAVPAWNGGPMTCGSCHAMPPNNAYWHSGNHGAAGGNDCQLCHPDATGTITSVPGAAVSVTGLAITNPAQHVNGTIELKPQWADTCYDCH